MRVTIRDRADEWESLDRRIHSLAMLALAEREVAKRLSRRRIKRALKAPLLWLVAGLGAFLTWMAS